MPGAVIGGGRMTAGTACRTCGSVPREDAGFVDQVGTARRIESVNIIEDSHCIWIDEVSDVAQTKRKWFNDDKGDGSDPPDYRRRRH